MNRKRRSWAIIAPILLVAAIPWPLLGQSTVDFTGRSNLFVGYVASPPQQLFGIGVSGMLPALGGWGLFADAKLTTDSPAGRAFLSNRTPAQAEADGDLFFVRESAWATVNLAVIRGLTPEFALYLGGGATWETSYVQYEDGSGERGRDGLYWVEDAEESIVHPNLHAGAFFRMGHRLVVQFGGQTAPSGFVVGGHLRIL